MNSRLLITFFVCLFSSTIFASNNWEDFEAHDIYPKYDTTQCVFPFTYKGQTYNNCTTDGDNGNRPWCSLTSNYVGLFKYCYDFWQSTLQCVLPFDLNGRTFTECSLLSRVSKYKQCRSNNDNYRFRYCVEAHVTKSNRKLLNPTGCDPAYSNMSKEHSKCAGPSDFALPQPISDVDKQAIVDTHNRYRAEVGAKSMMKLYWDDTLAQLAQVHSDMCAFDHDLAANRLTLSYNWKNGQNMVMATEVRSTLSDLLVMMFESEKPRFQYGVGCNPPGTCTHYTQLMLSNMTRVGCGETHCIFPDRIERYLTCNYIHSQYADNYMTPYIPGSTPASDCPATKDANNLCDCGNKICDFKNGQNINPNTCQCEGGSAKRSLEENDFQEREHDEDDVDHIRDSFAAIPYATNLDSESNEKRAMRVISPKYHSKRNLRKISFPHKT